MSQLAVIPVPEMVGKLANGVVALAGAPHGLLGSKALHGDVRGNKPVFGIVGGVELLQEHAAEGCGWFLVLGGSGEREGEEEEED
jgi:hypothetical protein